MPAVVVFVKVLFVDVLLRPESDFFVSRHFWFTFILLLLRLYNQRKINNRQLMPLLRTEHKKMLIFMH